MAFHKSFGKFLAAFQLGSFCRRAYNGNMAGGIIFLLTIEEALHPRIFPAHDKHAGILFKRGNL